LSAIDFGATLAGLATTAIFFKLQAGMVLVSSAPSPPPTCAHAAPVPCQNLLFKKL
jgi:hypothetical protein